MADSDEDEMKAMRASDRYAGVKKPTAPAASAATNSDDDASMAASHGGGSQKARASTVAASVAPEEMSEVEEEKPEDLEEARGFLPVTFGKPTKGNAKPPEKKPVVEKKAGVQFGSRLMDAATAAGARGRLGRAEISGNRAQPQPQPDSDDDVGPKPRAQEESQSEDEMMPLPGMENQVVPVSHEVSIPAYEKCVTAMALDPKGSRMVTGSIDGCVKLFDFNGMSETKEAFRSLEPVESHVVGACSWAITGGSILVICSDTHARIFDRDGTAKPLQMTVKGDMYVRDMQHTKGHTQTLTDGSWHPFQRDMFLTSSLDGTLRIWDVNGKLEGMDQELSSLHVLKTLDKRNVCIGGGSGRDGGLHPRCCVYSPADAKHIVAGCSDGSVQVFFDKARFQKPDRILRSSAHTAAVTGISFLLEGSHSNIMVTRSTDSTMKIWDLRMLSDAKGPVKVIENLPANNERTGVCTSPDGRHIVTGTSFAKGAGSASLRVYDAKGYDLTKTVDLGPRGVTRLIWSQELNQLVVGTTTGEVIMFYSPFSSQKGALHFIGKKAKSKPVFDIEDSTSGPIFNMTDTTDIKKFYATGHGNMTKIRRAEARHSQKTVVPQKPPSLQGGAAAASAEGSFAALALKMGAKRLNLNSTRPGITEEDSQKALLKYQSKTEQATAVQTLVDRAYAKTQPQKLLDWSTEQSEGDLRMQAFQKGDFCRKCGMKNCRCVDYSIWGESGKRPRTK